MNKRKQVEQTLKLVCFWLNKIIYVNIIAIKLKLTAILIMLSVLRPFFNC